MLIAIKNDYIKYREILNTQSIFSILKGLVISSQKTFKILSCSSDISTDKIEKFVSNIQWTNPYYQL